MANTYVRPAVVELGDFHIETGEWKGPYTEAVLFWRDYSYDG